MALSLEAFAQVTGAVGGIGKNPVLAAIAHRAWSEALADHPGAL
ncbi:hypothetical protein [Streptomyces sp. NPDC056361]